MTDRVICPIVNRLFFDETCRLDCRYGNAFATEEYRRLSPAGAVRIAFLATCVAFLKTTSPICHLFESGAAVTTLTRTAKRYLIVATGQFRSIARCDALPLNRFTSQALAVRIGNRAVAIGGILYDITGLLNLLIGHNVVTIDFRPGTPV